MIETTLCRRMILIFALLLIVLVVFVVPQNPDINLEKIEKERMKGGQLLPVLVQL